MHINKRSFIKSCLYCWFTIFIAFLCSCNGTVSSVEDSFLYDDILFAVLNGDAELVFNKPVAIKDVTDIYTSIYEYEPEVNGLSKSVSYKKLNDESDLITSLAFNYTLSKEEIKERHIQTLEQIDNLLPKIPSDADFNSKLQRAVALFTEGLVYDDLSSDCNTAYAAVCKKSANCQGISKAFALICNKMGLKTGYCIGELNGYPHMWNYIEESNQIIQIDLTNHITNEDDYVVGAYFDNGNRILKDYITLYSFYF